MGGTINDINRDLTFQFNDQFTIQSFIDYIPPANNYTLFTNLTNNQLRVKRQDDKILLSEVYINNKRHSLARFTNSGELDNSFEFDQENLSLPSNLKYTFIRDFNITPSGKIFLFLTNLKFSNSIYSPSFLQLDENGGLDNSFFGLTKFYKPTHINLGPPNSNYHGENIGYVRADNKVIWATNVNYPQGTYENISFPNHLNLLTSNGNVDESFQSVSLSYAISQEYCNSGYFTMPAPVEFVPLPNNETIIYALFTSSYCNFGQANPPGGSEKAMIGRIDAQGNFITKFDHLNLPNFFTAAIHDGYLYLGKNFMKKIDLATNNDVTSDPEIGFTFDNQSGMVYDILFKDNNLYLLLYKQTQNYDTYFYELKRFNLDGSLDNTFQPIQIERKEINSYFYNMSSGNEWRKELKMIDNPGENSFLLVSRFPFKLNGAYYEQAFVKISFPEIYNINTSSNPTNGGITSGGGTYNEGDNVTVTANAASGYVFVNWTENGNVVSPDSSYTFEATSNRNLIANFEQEMSISDLSTNEITIYPNPFDKFINLKAEGILIEGVEIYDISGKIINKLNALKVSSYQIDTQAMNKGAYLIKVYTGKGEIKTFKVIKK